MPLLARLELFNLLLEVLIGEETGLLLVLRSIFPVVVLDLLLEGIELGADLPCLLLGGLLLANLADSILYAFVALFQQFFGLLFSLGEDSLTLGIHIRDAFLISLDASLKFFLFLMNRLTFLLPVTLVADDVLKILVALDIVGPHDLRSLLDNLFRQTYLARYLCFVNVMRNMSVSCDCEGVAAQPVVTPNVGILSSTDILAVDQACIDMIYAMTAEEHHDMVERIESRHGLRQLSYMKELGMGNNKYVLIDLDNGGKRITAAEAVKGLKPFVKDNEK